MSKVSKIAAGLAVVPMLAFAAPAFADSPGDLAGGADIYQVRNVTTNSSYSSAASAACNETVKYSVKLSNTDFGMLSNVTVKASLTSGDMTASATTSANTTTTTSGKVTVTPATGGNLVYVAGSTQLFTVEGQLIKALPDGVTTTSGVNAGSLAGSTREFLQFQAKVNCQTTPKTIKVCELATKQVITINEDQFDSAKHSKDLSKCQTTTTPPTVLANTGPGQVAGIFAATVVAAGAGFRFVLGRRAARQ
jgi:hypothetical protein